jgi:biotin transport system substrate-specific component
MTLATRIETTRLNIFTWRNELSVPRKLSLALGVAILTGILAQVRIYLPGALCL